MRRLSLHASALNDEEYTLFTDSILDLAVPTSESSHSTNARDDVFYECITVSVREVRAWLRGRYLDIPVTSIDTLRTISQILGFFSSALVQGETLSGGQFFAILRLVVHVQHGKETDRALAFVQSHPSPLAPLSSPTNHPSFTASPQSTTLVEDSCAASITSDPILSQTNPFSHAPGPQPPSHSSQGPEPGKTAHSPHNPFVPQRKPTPPRSENGSNKLPPLPPRKPPVPAPPPRHYASASSIPFSRPTPPTSNLSRTPQPIHSHHPQTPPPLPKPKPSTHVTSTLIRQSLQASKAAQTMKKAEEQLEKERVLQVLRSSAVVSGARSFAGATITHSSISIGSNISGSNRSPSRTAVPAGVATSDSSASLSGEDSGSRGRPPLPRRRHEQQQPSPPISASSLEQVALAVAPSGSKSRTSYSSSPFDSPDSSPRGRNGLELPCVAGLPPPTHPDRKPHHGPGGVSPFHVRSSSTDEPSPFKRNLEPFEAAYGNGQLISGGVPALSMEPTSMIPVAGTTDTVDVTSPTSGGSPSARMYRSKSLHAHSHPPPPPPPVRRKRPESVQIFSNGEKLFGGGAGSKDLPINNIVLKKSSMAMSREGVSGGAQRRSSVTGNGYAGAGLPSSGTESIQRTFAGLQLKAENALPKLEAARYKAEAGLSKRGFIKGSERGRGWSSSGYRQREERENLMSREYEEYGNGDDSRGVSVDSGDDEDDRRLNLPRERDELKWPVGEGWRML